MIPPTHKLSAVIVDDEPLARDRIRSLLEKEPDIEIIADYASGVEALPALKQNRPDLLFLDIQMPEMTGFEMLEKLEEPLPVTIFITAFDQHAIKAFEVHALDYLLKPFKQARFRETLDRARSLLGAKHNEDLSQRVLEMLSGRKSGQSYLSRISIKLDERLVFFKVEGVDWIEAAGNYLVVHVGKESHLIRETLTSMEAKLDPAQFLRISRSALVNLSRVKELQPLFNGEHAVVLENGKHLTMTRGLREVEDRLKFS